MDAIKVFIQINYIQIIFAFAASFLGGILLSLSAIGINREGRKKGFRTGRYSGKDKEIDRQLLREYEDDLGVNSYLQDDMEHHASKKFIS